MQTGWIKLYRKLLSWEWYTDSNMVHLLIHLMLSANHKDGTWRGTVVKRGQLITGRKQLSSQTGIPEQSIRTCLGRLESTSEITSKSTNKFTVITICNYDEYQSEQLQTNQQINQQPTSNQPTTNQPANQQLTTNKNEEKLKNKKKEKKESVSVPLKDGSFFSPDLEEYELWVKTYSCNVDEELGKLVVWNINNPKKRKTAKGVKRHICSWLDGAKSNTKGDRYAGIDFSKKH